MKVKRLCLTMVALMLISACVLFPGPAAAAGQFLDGSYGAKPYKLYVPNGYDASRSYPLYVMLHGCTQDANQFAAGTRMNTLADEKGFLVLYPEQTSSANSNKCWNWFESAHQARGSGEPAVIAGMVNKVKSSYSIQGDEVYASGLSAGAAMSVIMGAAYPDLFSGIGVGAGLEYKAATSMTGAFTAMSSGGPSPVQQGNLAYQAMSSRAKIMPVIVFHGTSDYTVYPVNGNQVISQWAATNDLAENGIADGWIDDQPERTVNAVVSGGRSYNVSDFEGLDRRVWMRKVTIQGMGHAWSGGSSQGSYTDPQGPDASRMMWEFFDSFTDRGGGENDTTAPVTSASPEGGTYNAPVQVTLQTNEEASTYYTTDGSDPTIQSALYTGPIQITDDTILRYFSLDPSGNSETIKQEIYVIDESSPPSEGVTISSISAEDGFAGQLTADSIGTGDIKVGDKGMYNTDTYRGILSFDTSQLGQTAIQSATIRLYIKSVAGTVSSISADIKNGTFGAAGIEQSDYSALASLGNAAVFQSPPASGYIDLKLSGASLTQINKNGKTQFRLKAVTTPGFSQNQIEFYGGGSGGQSPIFIIND
ncbi:poly(3-hydroxybutyrate) depolymerase [[Bacillus] enclensis]|jgi:poly(hydroxyalkanoate) depolymerase family esterase|uniref:Esterase, PHB depolymerase family n=1 Tax=[Bacillus] enclensis TaxID=1402860 RepID=A0A0V8HKN2_9BACI|nr:PHB depolymerase family esterase [[Bacillus] enclensis]KSU63203.1 poly(3-hydroxybutyrate) depolymerase [[Bacillus] enclensis]QWC21228.1 PHB depolymerase family esterase [Bacillus haikouensis]SCB80080.1 esterase, PHB depolymerase family [[Bacillus] enclensis]